MAKIQDIQWVDIDKINPYEKNAKVHTENQVEKIAESIKEFGFLTPCIIDKDNNLIAGHGRRLAAISLDMEKIPCIRVEGLTEEQKKAYILADNRLSELGEWDIDLVNDEIEDLAGLDFDIDLTGFELPEVPQPDNGYVGDERERTFNAYNLEIAVGLDKTDDIWQMPIIKPCDHIPDRLIGFNYAKTSKDKDAGIHFFLDDYQFERIWNTPERYIDTLWDYDCILSPDFSLYMDMDIPLKIWNIYRSRLIGAFYQSQGVKVIPTVSWAEPETYTFCFRGLPKESTLAVSTIGVKNGKEAYEVWKDGMNAMIKELNPKTILIYGGELEYDFGGINTRFYDNEVTKEWI